jgi:CxxC motif-containing protein (DUF1111 family)
MRSIAVLAFLCAACEPPPSYVIVSEDPTDNPVANLDADQQKRFDRGDAAFEALKRESQGLGPLYIRAACASCHADDAKGPGFVTKIVIVEDDGFTPAADQSALAFGHTVRPFLTSGATTPIDIPEGIDNLKVSTRIGPAVFGRGFLEAIADEEIERVESEQQARGDDITGRIHRVAFQSEANPDTRFHSHAPGDVSLIGRFGFKARIASLDEFTADAFQGDMGFTSLMRPNELPNPDGLADDVAQGIDMDIDTINDIADYMRLLAIPRRADVAGADLFAQVECAVCHVPSMKTRADYPYEQLRNIDAPIFSDLLLHDLGADLADGLVDGDAGPTEWKTAPLIGLRHLRNYLHDGRAATIDEAIRLHAGEASASVAKYEALGDDERNTLLEYLSTL